MGNEALLITGLLSFAGIFIAIAMRHTKSKPIEVEAQQEEIKKESGQIQLSVSEQPSSTTNIEPPTEQMIRFATAVSEFAPEEYTDEMRVSIDKTNDYISRNKKHMIRAKFKDSPLFERRRKEKAEKQKAFKPYTVKQPSRLKRIYQKLPGVVWVFWIVLIALWIAYPDASDAWFVLALFLGIPAIINGLHVNSMNAREYQKYLDGARQLNQMEREREQSGFAAGYDLGGFIGGDDK